MNETCFACGRAIPEGAALVLAHGARRETHCSERCLAETVRRHQRARQRRRRRWALGSSAAALLLVAAAVVWQRFRMPPAQSISYDVLDEWPEVAPPSGPPLYGPPWPPTDEDWERAFEQASFIHPLPGPGRRAPVADARLLGPEPSQGRRPLCRTEAICGVDLGGELWGEHVYAALDGVVDRVQAAGNEPRGGISVRIAHFGGMVFTQYFHLAATRRSVTRGARVKAGDLIGLLGDTGLPAGDRHLHFTLSVRPSQELAEVYWDPSPLLARWPLRVPPNGTVAGFAPPELVPAPPRRRRWR